MLGYAEAPADLALGREIDRAAHRRPRPLARRPLRGRRTAQPLRQGLRPRASTSRPSSDAPGRASTGMPASWPPTAPSTSSSPAAAAPRRARAGRRPVRRTRRTRSGSPCCRRCRSTSSGKTDYAALGELAARRPEQRRRTTPAGRRRTVRADVRPRARPTRRQRRRLVRRPRRRLAVLRRARDPARRPLPGRRCRPGWHTRSIGELERLAAADAPRRPPPGTAARGGRGSTRRSRCGRSRSCSSSPATWTSSASRAAPTCCSRSPGFNFARFQLSAPGDARTRLRHGLAGLAQLVVPSVLWVGARRAPARQLRPHHGAVRPRAGQRLGVGRPVAAVVPPVARLDHRRRPRRHLRCRCCTASSGATPFRFALGVLGRGDRRAASPRSACAPARPQRYTTLVVAFFFALGWAARAPRPPGSASLVTALAAALTVGFFGEPHREAIVLGGFLLLLWLPHVPAAAAAGAGRGCARRRRACSSTSPTGRSTRRSRTRATSGSRSRPRSQSASPTDASYARCTRQSVAPCSGRGSLPSGSPPAARRRPVQCHRQEFSRELEEGPHRQPRRDRRPCHPRLQGRRHRLRRGLRRPRP